MGKKHKKQFGGYGGQGMGMGPGMAQGMGPAMGQGFGNGAGPEMGNGMGQGMGQQGMGYGMGAGMGHHGMGHQGMGQHGMGYGMGYGAAAHAAGGAPGEPMAGAWGTGPFDAGLLQGLPAFLRSRNTEQFLLGAAIGAAAAWILSDEELRGKLVKAGMKLYAGVAGGFEEMKEQMKDIKAEVEAEKHKEA